MLSDSLADLIWTQAWQIAVVFFIAAVTVRTLLQNRPFVAYGIWLIVALKCVTPPIGGHPLAVASQLPAPPGLFSSEPPVELLPSTALTNITISSLPRDIDTAVVLSHELSSEYPEAFLADETPPENQPSQWAVWIFFCAACGSAASVLLLS